jgi:hypothetical protein
VFLGVGGGEGSEIKSRFCQRHMYDDVTLSVWDGIGRLGSWPTICLEYYVHMYICFRRKVE